MIVDDDDLLRRVLIRGLSGDCSVRGVDSVEGALDALSAGERFDLILFDLSVGPAVDFVRAVRASASGQERHVALFSGADRIDPIAV